MQAGGEGYLGLLRQLRSFFSVLLSAACAQRRLGTALAIAVKLRRLCSLFHDHRYIVKCKLVHRRSPFGPLRCPSLEQTHIHFSAAAD